MAAWYKCTFHRLCYEHDWQRKRTKYTVPQVAKGTSLHCYYVKMCRTGVTCIFTCSTHFYIISVKGCSFVYLRNCIFCPLSLSVMFIVVTVWCHTLDSCHLLISIMCFWCVSIANTQFRLCFWNLEEWLDKLHLAKRNLKEKKRGGGELGMDW